MPFAKGRKRTGGRPKGKPNHHTIAVKAALEEAFNELDGVAGLIKFARKYPIEFYKLWGKLLPVTAEISGTLVTTQVTEVSIVHHAAAPEPSPVRGVEPHANGHASPIEFSPRPIESVGV